MMENQVDDIERDYHSAMDVDREAIAIDQPSVSNVNAGTDVENIKIDSGLKLSHTMEDVKTKIEGKVRKYVTFDEKLSCNVSQNPAFPTDYALVQLASIVYADFDKQPKLPDGWQFLTQASNNELNNGYYGCAYFNAEHQQIVIAHRGTNSLNAVWNDVKGIVYTKFVAQMNAAATFTEMILDLIDNFNRDGAYLKLSFTGHSLGGWLAQITAFTVKYLTRDEHRKDIFSLRKTQLGHHAHTVVFESPGCKQMLKNLKTKYIIHRYGRVNSANNIQISIESLDITTYLSAPNRINCCNAHVGKLYRISVNLQDWNTDANARFIWRAITLPKRALNRFFNLFTKKIRYTKVSHSIERIVECFDSNTGLVKSDNNGKLDAQEVLNWPIIEGIIFSDSTEYENVFDWVSQFENYRPPADESYSGNRNIRYNTIDVDENIFQLNVFNDTEIHFLKCYDICRLIPKFESVIFSVDTDDSKRALNSAIQKLDSMKFEIVGDKQLKLLDSEVKSFEFISYVKQFNHFFPLLNRIKQSTKDLTFDLVLEIYKTESIEYLSPIRGNSLEFDLDSFNLNQFLNDENSQVLLQVEKITSAGVLKIYKIFESVKANTKYGKSLFLDVKTILQLKQLSFSSTLEQIKDDYLIVIENNENSQAAVDLLEEIFGKVKGNPKIKVILNVDRESKEDWKSIVGEHERSDHEGIQLSDLSSDTREEILKRPLINLQGSRVSLAQIIPDLENLKSEKSAPKNDQLKSIVSTEILMKLGNQEEIRAGNELAELGKIEDFYIERTLTKNEKHFIPRALSDNESAIFAIENTEVDAVNDNKIPGVLMVHYEQWVLAKGATSIHYIILEVNDAENQFKDICEFYHNKSHIHWLTGTKYGSDYIYKHKQSCLCPNVTDVIDWVLYEVQYKEDMNAKTNNIMHTDDIRDTVVTVVGLPGMGKSVFFTSLALCKKDFYPFMWIVEIRLNLISWEDFPYIKQNINNKLVIEFLANILNLESDFEKSLFEYCLHDEKVVLILDAFDEVSPKYDDQIFGLLDTLQTEMKVKQLWLSSRPYALKDEQSVGTVYTLEGFSRGEQMEFLLLFWRKRISGVIEMWSCTIFRLKVLGSMPLDITGTSMAEIPLVLKLMAEYYQYDFENMNKSVEPTCGKLQETGIHNFYEELIKKKIGLMCSEKCDMKTKSQDVCVISTKLLKITHDEHKLLALVSCHLDSLVTDQYITIKDLINSINNCEEITGFISGVVNGVPQFIHGTFAEYFAALWLIEQVVATEDEGRLMKLFEGFWDLLQRSRHLVLGLLNSQLGVNGVLKQKFPKFLHEKKELIGNLSKVAEIYLNITRILVTLDVDNETLYRKSGELIVYGVEMELTDIVESFCIYKYGDACDYASVILACGLLFTAAKTNFSGSMTLFLLNKVPSGRLKDVINACHKSGETALHVAALSNRLEVAKVFLANGADVDLRDLTGEMALDVALRHENSEMVELLLYKWAIISPVDFVKTCEYIKDEKASVIFMNFIEKCFEKSSQSSTSGEHTQSQSSTTVGSPDHTLIDSLMSLGVEEVTEVQYDLTSLLHSENPIVDVSDVMDAASHYPGYQKTVIALIGNVALNYPNYLSWLFCSMNCEGQTLLHIAAKMDYVATAELMVGLGADINIRNKNGDTALSVAAKYRNYAFVFWVISRSDDEAINKAVYSVDKLTDGQFLELIDKRLSDQIQLLTKRYDGGDTMLHIAAQLNLVKLAENIIDRGGVVNVRNDDNHTPLSLACKNGNLEMFRLLIDKGALIDDDLQSPLLWAIYCKSSEVVNLLVEMGADVNARCPFPLAINNGMSKWTPLQLLVNRYNLGLPSDKMRCLGLAKILIFNGADFMSCFYQFPFHISGYYADLIVLFIMCGADIYTKDIPGVSCVTYLEEHCQSKCYGDQRLLLSVLLFSNCKPPEQLLKTIQSCEESSTAKRNFEFTKIFVDQLEKKIPDFFKLINACKAKDLREIQQLLQAVVVSEEAFDRSRRHIEQLILLEFPSKLHNYLNCYEILSECVDFFKVKISFLMKRDICSLSEPNFLIYRSLKSLSEICDKYCNNSES